MSEIASNQHGLITLAQLDEHYSRKQISTMKQNGLLKWVQPSTYCVVGSPQSWTQSVAAALLTMPEAAATHHTAMRLWNLGSEIDEVEVILPAGLHPKPVDVFLHFSDGEISWRITNGLRVTTPERTLISVACSLRDWQLENAFERMLTLQLGTFASMRNEIDLIAARGRNGVGVMRELLDKYDTEDRRCASPFERRLRRALLQLGLPEPDKQLRIPTAEQSNRYIDFGYRQLRLGIEADSRAYHARLTDFEKDWDRNGQLIEAGWTIVHVTNRNFEVGIARVARLYHRFSREAGAA